MTKDIIEKIREHIETSALSDKVKWYLRQFLHSTMCGCGHTLVHNGALTVISSPERKQSLENELNESGIATVETGVIVTDSVSGRIKYRLAVHFLPV